MRIGDIVTLRGRTGYWIFGGVSRAAIPPLEMGKFVRAAGSREAITIGLASAVLITSPSFSPGETVTHEHQPATVEADGDDTVVLTYDARRVAVPPRGYDGEHFTHSGRVFAERAQLVRDNLTRFITT